MAFNIQEIDLPSDINVYVVGDIHGCYSLLMKKLKEINFDFSKDLLISVGDLVDRGDKNEQCFDLLNQSWFKAVKGNHEDFCVNGFYNDAVAYSHKAENNGGLWFYQLPENLQQYIVEKFSKLPILMEVKYNNKKFGFVHADVPIHDWNQLKKEVKNNSKSFGRNIVDFCLWSRDIVYMDDVLIKNIDNVFLGHTVLDKITQIGNCTFLDTGAVFYPKDTTKYLSIVNLKDYL